MIIIIFSIMKVQCPPLASEARPSSGVKNWEKLCASSSLVGTYLYDDDDDVEVDDDGDDCGDDDDLPLQVLSGWDQTRQKQEARQSQGTSILPEDDVAIM